MKPFAASCERNQDPILNALRPILTRYGDCQVLEVGSGTGQHGVFFASALPWVTWTLSDRAENHAGIEAWRNEADLKNLLGPLLLDVNDFPDVEPPVQVVFSANTAHIMRWQEVTLMIAGAANALAEDGRLLVYGPFRRDGAHTSEGNEAFDHSLRQMSPSMGIRDLEAVDGVARDAGLTLVAVHQMPANNLLVEWRKATSST
ncbi:MAG: DUF938 domain-containing protein [Pseudomonadota bacterium]